MQSTRKSSWEEVKDRRERAKKSTRCLRDMGGVVFGMTSVHIDMGGRVGVRSKWFLMRFCATRFKYTNSQAGQPPLDWICLTYPGLQQQFPSIETYSVN